MYTTGVRRRRPSHSLFYVRTCCHNLPHFVIYSSVYTMLASAIYYPISTIYYLPSTFYHLACTVYSAVSNTILYTPYTIRYMIHDIPYYDTA